MPPRMQAIEISEHGGPDVLKPVEMETPTPKPGEVLVRVRAAGVNRPDVSQRAGMYPPPPGASPLPGLEIAGEIAALGDGVRQWQVGNTVCALTPGGGYADYCVVPAGHCLPIPAGFDMIRAAALPETFFTVYYNLFMRCGLKAGERLLVHGGSSGIGTTAIQLAKAFGAHVAVTAGSTEKCQACLDLGADAAINYKDGAWPSEVAAWAETLGNGPGLDVILDMVGGPYIDPGIKLLRRDGRYNFIAFLKGPRAEVDFSRVLMNRLTVMGATLRPQTIAEKEAIADNLRRDVWPLLEAGKIGPVIFKDFPLDQASEAHRLMESSSHIGKIMLTVD
ncbi:NAD(P)H-quinone oxidoreductase [Rhodospirillaceae bacterium KN72]|uniref:NAD(P)H-quinone oxidoreductase n=1 Tax=Pacificispira spongiicola TaxID=2729598 RepID=A0A7Y0DXM7_9PROT|nr:NAD(P)H-quinone oxidoreductase [Pacificispira spongiicola]